MFIRLSFNLLLCLLSSFSLEGQLSGMQASDWSVAIGRDKSGLEIQRELSGGVKISTERDMLERVTEQSIFSGSVEKSHMRFHWDLGNRLLRKTNLLTGESVHFDYDPWDNLFKADYKDGKQVETLYKAPDAIGNLFRTSERKDRKYGKSGRLLEDRKYSYHYDGEGNLVLKSRLRPEAPTTPLGQEGDWSYEWQGNGMLRSVKRPNGETVEFEYDPLGRRISKTYKGKTTHWVWDGNVPLHEWTEESDVTTWLFEEGTFVPTAKIVGDKSYSIITDYLGTPIHAFDSHGAKVWERNLDIYGKIRTGNSTLVPFLFQGQYFDEEIDLCYNRFRYYDPSTGTYISQDPISIAGRLNTYAYVHDSNSWIDPFGLSGMHGHHSDSKFMGGDSKQSLTDIKTEDHIDLHRDMNAYLETKTKVVNGETVSMRPKRGNSGRIIRQNFTRQERLDALAEFYTKNKKKYPQASADFFAQHPQLQKTGCK
ncbi:RHS repeat-associated core domain-containing protein [Porphyromonas endodontalis]|uniref:RHS repeat domain-containing protein n=1 Tax=Porphyromonas endodontalis TaxID=28124 RepID=UPI0028EDAAA7|nr:RHS repeat-associated core domain-containing protein [Porphyromonas endodontalis]